MPADTAGLDMKVDPPDARGSLDPQPKGIVVEQLAHQLPFLVDWCRGDLLFHGDHRWIEAVQRVPGDGHQQAVKIPWLHRCIDPQARMYIALGYDKWGQHSPAATRTLQ